MYKRLKQIFVCAILAAAVFTTCQQDKPYRSEFVFKTLCKITLFDEGKPEVYRNIFRRLREIENRMSVNIETSDVYAINKAAGIKAAAVNDDVFYVIEKAIAYAEMSGGAFDPTIGPLVSLWGITEENPQVPAQDEIENALTLVNWREVELDSVNKTVFLKKPGMALDLGGIAKGYAADEAARIIKDAGITRAIIDLGGNILVAGIKQNQTPWFVGIQNPLANRNVSIGTVAIDEKSVVTSGVYERFFETDGSKYHHIFSPYDGYPARGGIMSVTVITSISLDADALSTSAFVLGLEQGMALIESIEGAEALFVMENKSIIKSAGANFSLSDSNYVMGNF